MYNNCSFNWVDGNENETVRLFLLERISRNITSKYEMETWIFELAKIFMMRVWK